MDQRLPYEQIIAGKLEHLPVPDMEDMIWSRIKGQLDMDMPEDDGGSEGPSSPGGPGIIGWGFTIAIMALIIFFITGNQTNTPHTTHSPAIESVTDQTPEQSQGPPGTKSLPGTLQTTTKNGSPSSNIPERSDSAAAVLHTMPSVVDDSIAGSATTPILVRAAPKDTVPPTARRPRGVTGISDSSYRIVPKKDP